MSFLDSIQFGTVLTVLGAALAATFPGMGSAKAVGGVGVPALGVLTEDPEKYGKLLILQALPGTQGIYGLLCLFVIISSSNLGQAPIPMDQGFLYFLASLPIAIVGYFSAIHQGRVCESGVALVAKRPEEQVKSLIMAALVETYAILALLATILIIFNVKK